MVVHRAFQQTFLDYRSAPLKPKAKLRYRTFQTDNPDSCDEASSLVDKPPEALQLKIKQKVTQRADKQSQKTKGKSKKDNSNFLDKAGSPVNESPESLQKKIKPKVTQSADKPNQKKKRKSKKRPRKKRPGKGD